MGGNLSRGPLVLPQCYYWLEKMDLLCFILSSVTKWVPRPDASELHKIV